ncbi:Uncharacterised protein [Neisseria meningitidis]|nr:Uncharacterised protein [Neisseria meningitidis]
MRRGQRRFLPVGFRDIAAAAPLGKTPSSGVPPAAAGNTSADAKPAPAAGYAETVSDGICIGITKIRTRRAKPQTVQIVRVLQYFKECSLRAKARHAVLVFVNPLYPFAPAKPCCTDATRLFSFCCPNVNFRQKTSKITPPEFA